VTPFETPDMSDVDTEDEDVLGVPTKPTKKNPRNSYCEVIKSTTNEDGQNHANFSAVNIMTSGTTNFQCMSFISYYEASDMQQHIMVAISVPSDYSRTRWRGKWSLMFLRMA
jgi:hypothetical protein